MFFFLYLHCGLSLGYDSLYKNFFIVLGSSIHAFVEEIKPHQKALLLDNSIVSNSAMIENNLLSTRKIYKNMNVVVLHGSFVGLEMDASMVLLDLLREEDLMMIPKEFGRIPSMVFGHRRVEEGAML